MDIIELARQAKDTATVGRVFGEPIERDGVLIIPVARVVQGGGGGSGKREGEQPSQGYGGGFGLLATPSGVFVVRNGEVRWQPVVDVNRIVVGGQIVAVVLLLTVRAIFRARSGRRR